MSIHNLQKPLYTYQVACLLLLECLFHTTHNSGQTTNDVHYSTMLFQGFRVRVTKREIVFIDII